MIGTVADSSRMIFVASSPSRFGILMSIKIRSGFTSSNIVTASIPSCARISRWSLPRMASNKSKLLSVSSAIKIQACRVFTELSTLESTAFPADAIPAMFPSPFSFFEGTAFAGFAIVYGKVNVNVVPLPNSELTEILPPRRSTIDLQIDNPNPVPCA